MSPESCCSQLRDIVTMSSPRPSLSKKAAHFVSDLTTGLLNPISDKDSHPPKVYQEMLTRNEENNLEQDSGSAFQDKGPDTSSFKAFLCSLLLPSESSPHQPEEEEEEHGTTNDTSMGYGQKENDGQKILFGRRKKLLGHAVMHVVGASTNGCQNKLCTSDFLGETDVSSPRLPGCKMQTFEVPESMVPNSTLPEMSEPSVLLSENTRRTLSYSLPALIRGTKWVLAFSTWRHGISLSTLYRRSSLCPGYCLLVVGDREGAVFGGLVEAPLTPTNMRKYQGTNHSFVFTDISNCPTIFRATGVNRYFTLCSSEFLALGGGGHFALYLDGDLLNGSSSASETFGNTCLAHAEEFEVKEVELWGFEYSPKYGGGTESPRNAAEAPGLFNRW